MIDDFEEMRFKNFQDPLPSNSETFKTAFGYQKLSSDKKLNKLLA